MATQHNQSKQQIMVRASHLLDGRLHNQQQALRHEAEVLLYNKVQLMKAIDEATEHNEEQERNMDAMHKHHQALVATAEQARDAFATFLAQVDKGSLTSS